MDLRHLHAIGLPYVSKRPAVRWTSRDEGAHGPAFASRLRLAHRADFGAVVRKSPEGIVSISGCGLADFRLVGRTWTAVDATVLELIQRAAYSLRNEVRPPRTDDAERLEDVGRRFAQEEVVVELRDTSGGCIDSPGLLRAYPQPLLEEFSLDGIARHILTSGARNILVLCGAGISTSAGIPDFRSPDGLYATLREKYPALSRPEDMFTLDYFRRDPWPFYQICRDMWPGNFRPTPCHAFIRLLEAKGLLLRCYTQNIDSMESLAGVSRERLVMAHGNFDSAHVAGAIGGADVDVPIGELHRAVLGGRGALEALRQRCGGWVKPRIVFFGEPLPSRFMQLRDADFPMCDLVLVMGTSLKVPPFSSLLAEVPLDVPRLLINRDMVGLEGPDGLEGGFRFGRHGYRDVFHCGATDAACAALAEQLGWTSDLEAILAGFGL